MPLAGGHSFFGLDAFTEVDAVLLTAAIAAAIAIWSVLSQRKIARQQLMMQHLERAELDKDMIKARQTFVECTKEEGGLEKYADLGREQDPKTQDIRLVLNDYERISIGIQQNIYDFDIAHRFAKTAIIKFFEKGEPFIKRLRERTKTPSLYSDFERMAEGMRNNLPPSRLKRDRLRDAWRALTGRPFPDTKNGN